jgi:hypothetical protein
MIERCSICGEYIFFPYHACKPKYFVWRKCEGIEEYINAPTIRATDYEDAATQYADLDFEFPDNEYVYVCSVEDYDKLLNENGGLLDEDSELTPEGLEKLKNICKVFELESEVVRNFYAHERENK